MTRFRKMQVDIQSFYECIEIDDFRLVAKCAWLTGRTQYRTADFITSHENR